MGTKPGSYAQGRLKLPTGSGPSPSQTQVRFAEGGHAAQSGTRPVGAASPCSLSSPILFPR